MLNGTSTTWNGLLPVLAASVPTPTTGRILFHESADGLLKSKDSSGVVTIIVETNAAGVIVGPISVRNLTESGMNLVTLLAGEIAWTSDYGQIRLGDGVTAGGLAGNMASSSTILCPPIGTPTENGAAFLAAHVEAKARITGGADAVEIVCGAGTYLFPTALAWDTSKIGIVGTGEATYDRASATATYPTTIFEFTTGDFENSSRNTRISGIQLVGGGMVFSDANGSDQSVFSSIGSDEDFTGTGGVAVASWFAGCVIMGEFFGTQFPRIETSGHIERSVFGESALQGDASGTYIDVLCISRGFAGSGSNTFSGLCIRCESLEGPAYGGGNGTFSGIAIDSIGRWATFGGPSGTTSGQLYGCKVGHYGLGTTSATTLLYDCLQETGDGTGIYEYMPENVKRLNGSDSPSATGIDMTSTATITWTNASGYALQVSSSLVLSNLDAGAETFSVAITSASGANTFTSTKASGATWTIPIPQFLGSVADAANYVIEISTDNVLNTSVNYTLNVVEQAVL